MIKSCLFSLSDQARYYKYHFFFFFNETDPTEIYTLSLHDALPIFRRSKFGVAIRAAAENADAARLVGISPEDRKSTRLNSSHVSISYAVFCLKKKKKKYKKYTQNQTPNRDRHYTYHHHHASYQLHH